MRQGKIGGDGRLAVGQWADGRLAEGLVVRTFTGGLASTGEDPQVRVEGLVRDLAARGPAFEGNSRTTQRSTKASAETRTGAQPQSDPTSMCVG